MWLEQQYKFKPNPNFPSAIIISSLPSSEITLMLLLGLIISVLSSETLVTDSVRTILAAENIFSVDQTLHTF